MQALRPRPLEEGGLADALRTLFGKLTEGVALRADFKVLGAPRALPPEWEENLFRIAQEVLTNALRHAQASRISAAIVFGPDGVRLEFADDGRGFDPAARSEGYGLLGMRDRVDAMGGRMEVRSANGRGAQVLIQLPASSPEALGSK